MLDCMTPCSFACLHYSMVHTRSIMLLQLHAWLSAVPQAANQTSLPQTCKASTPLISCLSQEKCSPRRVADPSAALRLDLLFTVYSPTAYTYSGKFMCSGCHYASVVPHSATLRFNSITVEKFFNIYILHKVYCKTFQQHSTQENTATQFS